MISWKVLFIFCSIVLFFSAIMDFWLWFTMGYMVPAWTVSGFIIGFMLMLIPVSRLVRKEELKK